MIHNVSVIILPKQNLSSNLLSNPFVNLTNSWEKRASSQVFYNVFSVSNGDFADRCSEEYSYRLAETRVLHHRHPHKLRVITTRNNDCTTLHEHSYRLHKSTELVYCTQPNASDSLIFTCSFTEDGEERVYLHEFESIFDQFLLSAVRINYSSRFVKNWFFERLLLFVY